MAVVTATAVATVGAGVISAKGAKDAAAIQAEAARAGSATQAEAAREANQLLREQFQATQGALQPFVTGGAPSFLLPPVPEGPTPQQEAIQAQNAIAQGNIDSTLAEIDQMRQAGDHFSANALQQELSQGNIPNTQIQQVPEGPQSTAGQSEAFGLQQAFSGALGPELQQKAFDQFNESPGVAFLRERGLRGIDRGAAARGNLIGGSTDKARIAFAQGLAQQDFGNQFNRLGAITGTQLGAAQALGGVGAQAAQGQAQNVVGSGFAQAQGLQNIGQAQAAGGLARSQALASGIGDLGAIFANKDLFNNPENPENPQNKPSTRGIGLKN